MARNIQISFALMSFAAQIDGARIVEPETRNLCKGQPGKTAHDPQLLQAPSQCPSCGPVTDFTVIVKGIKQGNTYAVLDQTVVKEAKEEVASKTKGKLTIVAVPSEDFLTKTAPGKALYFVTPGAGSEDHYQLLTHLVRNHPEKSFTSLYTPVSKEALYMLSVRDGVLCMEERTREQTLKPVPVVGGEVNQPMLDLLDANLALVSMPYDPDKYADTYAAKVADLVAASEETVTFGSPKASESPQATTDLADLAARLTELAAAAKE